MVYVTLAASACASFWSSLVEATYLTLRPFSLSASIRDGSAGAAAALDIVSEKTRLVSVTTFTDTVSNVVLASTLGLTLSGLFGPVGWLYSAVAGSLVIMTMLYLLPKAIGIENALRMSIYLAPSTKLAMSLMAPLTVPLTSLARSISHRLVGKPAYKQADLASEFEEVVTMLEKAGHIEPDAGRLLRTALSSSSSTAGDVATPVGEIISVGGDASVLDALKIMGKANHPRIPVYDSKRGDFIGAVTFQTLSKAIHRDQLESGILDYMIQPAKASVDDGLASVMERMQEAGTTIAFVFDGGKMTGMVTLSDIIENVIGLKV